VSVETGWAAAKWQARVEAGEALARHYHFEVVRLCSTPDFVALMQDRQEFPSTKFQWCAGFLKGLPLLNWLDKIDPQCESQIILGKRRHDSRANFNLPEYIEKSEYYGDRKIWYPLYDCSNETFMHLIEKTGLAPLSHRSLECDPCVNSRETELIRMSADTISRTSKLEKEIKKTLFNLPIEKMLLEVRRQSDEHTLSNKHSIEIFDMGCGSPYGCGE
jgi:hypothetical protein